MKIRRLSSSLRNVCATENVVIKSHAKKQDFCKFKQYKNRVNSYACQQECQNKTEITS